MLIELLSAALLALAVSLGLNRMMLVVAPRLGLLDHPGERRIHDRVIPRAGGIAIWLSFLLVAGAWRVFGHLMGGGYLPGGWLTAFVVSSTVLIVTGFFDDRTGLPPWLKLGAHVLAPTVFFLIHPLRTGLFPESCPHVYDYIVFAAWSVVLINAFNLIDGLDGLCGGLAAVSSLALTGLALVNNRMDSVLLLAVMSGAILGFLRYNFNPARIFLGDAGSMMVGFFLATAATDSVGRKAVVGMILLPIAVAGVPLLDVLLAIWRRSMRQHIGKMLGDKSKNRIFDADGDHLHHRLLESSGSQRKVAIVLQCAAILLSALAFLPMLFGERLLGISLVGILVVALLGLRNLARVEFDHAGRVIHMAIKLPGYPRRVATALFVHDFLVLVGSGALAVVIETGCRVGGHYMLDLERFALLFVIVGSIALFLARVHQRLWARATVRDVISLQFWVMVAALATFALFSQVHIGMGWASLRMMMTCYVFASAGICLPRVALVLFRDFGLEARHKSKTNDGMSYGPVVVYGAGDLGALLLDHLKSSSHDAYQGMRILGFIDDMPQVQGRRIRSFRILGGFSAIPKLAEEEGLKGVILAIQTPPKKLLDQLTEISERYDLKIYRWDVSLRQQ